MSQSAKSNEGDVEAVIKSLEPLLKRTESDDRPVAMMLCGVAGSGKSTYAKAVIRTIPTFQRVSIDGIIASRHGIYGIDYAKSEYRKYQGEADIIFQQTIEQVLDGNGDVVLDRSFYAREDRDFFKNLIETHGGRWVLVYLRVPRDVLWRRICARREAGINADSALEISEELLDTYCNGFEAPSGEGEVVFEMSDPSTQ